MVFFETSKRILTNFFTKRQPPMTRVLCSATVQNDDDREDEEEDKDNESPLWRVLQSRDIFQTHILPKLDSNSIKFLHASGPSCAKLLSQSFTGKRNERKLKKILRRPFKVREIESRSVLEYAFQERKEEEMREEEFTARIQSKELLEFALETKGWRVDHLSPRMASCAGNLEILRYLSETNRSYLLDEGALVASSFYNRKACLRFLTTKNVPCDVFAFGIGAFSRRWKSMFETYEQIIADDDDGEDGEGEEEEEEEEEEEKEDAF
jgi:hypothetical protein